MLGCRAVEITQVLNIDDTEYQSEKPASRPGDAAGEIHTRISGHPPLHHRVLDYGCGSGILAIAAARLGASATLGVDIDPNALIAARDNAANNQVDLQLRHSAQPLTETFDIVVANILTNPLCVLAPLLVQHIAAGGRIALSGVLETQAEQVITAYAPYLPLNIGATRDGWVRLEGRRC